MAHRETSPLRVRPANAADAERLAALSTELGYPSSPEQIQRRLRPLDGDADHLVSVAEVQAGQDGEAGRVVGWIHAYVSRVIESNPRAEIGGLVVDTGFRGAGVGRRLMEHAEGWARSKGLEAVYLRSNVMRQDAHRFYQGLGYKIIKTQHAFLKKL